MAKRFECPRCGSGVRPSDTQCFRCGELLVEAAAPVPSFSSSEARPASGSPATNGRVGRPEPLKATRGQAAKQVGEIRRLSTESAAEERSHLLEQKEKEIELREKAIEHSLEQLESDTRSLEEALKRYEAEEATVQEHERMLREREQALEAMAERMEQAAAEVEAKDQDRSQVLEEAQKLRQMGEEYSRHIAEDRARQKKLLDQEIDERMERLRTLQQMINIASQVKVEPPKEGDAEEIIRKMADPGYDPAVVSRALEQLDQEMRVEAEKQDKLQFEVISTHDERLDHILGGGVPAGHVVIVNGSPGTMKSTLCYYMMRKAVRYSGKKGMYLSLEQKRDSIIKQMERMGMPRAEVENDMMVVDMVDLRNAMKGEKGDWRQILMRYVKNVHAEMPFDMFVLDSLESFKALAQFDFSRQHMMDLFDWFKSLSITVMVIAEKPLDTLDDSEQGETYLADGVVELQLKEFDDAKVYRWMRCVKMRGMQIDPRYYTFYHNGQEFKFSLPLVTSGGG